MSCCNFVFWKEKKDGPFTKVLTADAEKNKSNMSRPAAPVFSRFDDSFSIHLSREYCLSILVARHGFSYCITRSDDNFVIGIECYSFTISDLRQSAGSDVKEWRSQLLMLLESLESLKKSFHQVRIAVEYAKSTLVPEAFFEETDKDAWIRFNHPVTDYELCRADRLPSAAAVMLYAVPLDILPVIAAAFPEATVCNASGQLIKCLISETKEAARDGVLYAHVKGAWVELIYLEDGKLKFFNIFSYQTREDLAYYVIFVIEQLGLNPDTTVLVLLGDIERESDHFELLYRYIRNIRLVDNSIMLEPVQITSGISFHTYFNLLNFARCES